MLTMVRADIIICLAGKLICGRGGTGRRVRLRGVWETVWVQVPSTAPEIVKSEHAAVYLYKRAVRMCFFQAKNIKKERSKQIRILLIQYNSHANLYFIWLFILP